MIRVHAFNWITCRWEWLWRPASVVRGMRHLTHAMIPIACAGIVIVTPPSPPVEAHSPPPPVDVVEGPPPGSWTPPGSPFAYVPPDEGGYVPGGPMFPIVPPAQGAELILSPSDLGDRGPNEVVGEATEVRDFRQAPILPLCPPDTPTTPIDEPGSALILALGLAGVVALRRKS